MEPLLEKSCILAKEALSGARMAGADLDRILLVGGPTQSPLLRTMLSARLGAPVDFSADPMTVVGRGAAVYASTLETTKNLHDPHNFNDRGLRAPKASLRTGQCGTALYGGGARGRPYPRDRNQG